MPHHIPQVRLSHELANRVFAELMPVTKKGKATTSLKVQDVLHDLQGKGVAHKTVRGKLKDGTDIAVHFNTVDGTIFAGLDKEVE